ncbi:MAG: leucine-rich repeat protein, partial [Clostridiales bacterium]|nr:leucine-rich repeat protein [Clostridiales bacterium]
MSSDEAGYTINWEALTANTPNQANLGMNAYAFAHSDLAGTITLPGNVDFDDYVFAYCDKLTSVDFSGTISRLGENLFMEDKALSEVRFGTFASPPAHGRNELSNRQFSGCDKLQRIEFTSATPPTLGFLGVGDAYAFTSAPEQDEKNKLTLTVPEESKQAYLDAWRYAFAGYEDTTINGIFKPAYQSMRENIKHTSKNISDEEVDAKIYQTLLSTENRLRGLLGMEKITKLDHLYNWKTTWGDDLFILTSAYTDATEITLDAEMLDLPEGWSIDYIGSHAFANAPNLTQVTADANTMLALYSGAFADAENHPITLIFTGNADPNTMGVGLVPAGDGKRFDFTGLEKVVLPEGTEQIFLDLWLYPTSGYEDYADLYLQTADELYEQKELTDDVEKNKELIDARMAEIMLPYENQLRRLF